jgi:hypothetical protein
MPQPQLRADQDAGDREVRALPCTDKTGGQWRIILTTPHAQFAQMNEQNGLKSQTAGAI